MRRFLLAAALVVYAAPAARADCTTLANGIVPYHLSNSTGAVTVVTQPTTTATALVQGALAYDTTANILKVCDGTNWQNLAPITAAGSTGQIQFNTGGSLGADSGLFWDNTNKRLGVGTNVPDAALTVNKPYYQSGLRILHGSTTSGGTMAVTVSQSQNAGGFAGYYASRGRSDGLAGLFLGTTGVALSASTPEWFSGIARSPGGSGFNFWVAEMNSGTSPSSSGNAASYSARLVVLPGGNVGIGTLTPTALTHLSGDGSIRDAILRIDSNGVGGGQTGTFYGVDISLIPNNNSTGSYGVAVEAPTAAGAGNQTAVYGQSRRWSSYQTSIGLHGLSIGNPGAYPASLPNIGVLGEAQSSGSTGMLNNYYGGYFKSAATYGAKSYGVYIDAVAGPTSVIPLAVASDGVERMRVAADGNVGIGTTTPQATLDVNGFAKLKKNTSAPVSCSGTYEGSIAYTGGTTRYLCFCDGTSWKQAHDPATACAW